MLKSLNVLPKEIKSIIGEFVVLPECVHVIDMASFDNEEGLSGGIYVVMTDDTPLWEEKYRSSEIRSMAYLVGLWRDSWDTTDGVLCTSANNPLYYTSLSDYKEGVDYRILTKEEAIKEVV